MRLGVVWQRGGANRYYRAIEPMKAMERRGHEVVWPPDGRGQADVRRLMRCDVVHVYRRASVDMRRAMAELVRGGTPITYDNDDDFTAVPAESPAYDQVGGLVGQGIFAMTVTAARMARVFTTTNEVLADKYRRAGVERVEVIPNCVAPGVDRSRQAHDGVVIGWVAGLDHRADTARVRIAEALEQVLARHEHVSVDCIGVDLGLTRRYTHDEHVPFGDLPRRIGGWDIGIAPLADLPVNHARSDIKLKEYAASGVPWLASPVGPYAGLGEAHGGKLVADDAWYEALERLATRGRERRRLARKANSWSKGQTIEAVADRWEHVFEEAAQ